MESASSLLFHLAHSSLSDELSFLIIRVKEFSEFGDCGVCMNDFLLCMSIVTVCRVSIRRVDVLLVVLIVRYSAVYRS